jgi:hypothetical protein
MDRGEMKISLVCADSGLFVSCLAVFTSEETEILIGTSKEVYLEITQR